MKTLETAGIDVSKSTLDVCLHLHKGHGRFANSSNGFKALLAWLQKQSGLELDQVLICFEHTGLYSLPLANYLSARKITFCMVSGLAIKKSLGIQRGKNDKVDASRIARYAHMHAGRLKPYALPGKALIQLQQLLQLRARLVRQRAGYKSSYKEC